MAASRDRKGWVLVNCSPDVGHQWNDLLHDYPDARLEAIVLTDDQLDHVGGLLSLRESDSPLDLHCRPSVERSLRDDARVLHLLDSYCGVRIHTLPEGDEVVVGGVSFRAHVLGTRRAKYASAPADVVALRVEGEALVAPCVAPEHLNDAFASLAGTCTTVLMDGTFYDEHEMPGVTGHVPMTIAWPFFEAHSLPPPLFVHVNNTNVYSDRWTTVKDGTEIPLRDASAVRPVHPASEIVGTVQDRPPC